MTLPRVSSADLCVLLGGLTFGLWAQVGWLTGQVVWDWLGARL